jgi:hypothetical protein
MDEPLWIFGTGAHARKVYHAAQGAGWRVAGFADERSGASAPVTGLPVIDVQALAAMPAGLAVFVAIGRPDVRERLMDLLAAQGVRLPAIVHARASVAPDAVLAAGVLVAAAAVVESGSRLGRGAIVDIGVVVDHDAEVAPFSHLLPGTVLPAGTGWPRA